MGRQLTISPWNTSHYTVHQKYFESQATHLEIYFKCLILFFVVKMTINFLFFFSRVQNEFLWFSRLESGGIAIKILCWGLSFRYSCTLTVNLFRIDSRETIINAASIKVNKINGEQTLEVSCFRSIRALRLELSKLFALIGRLEKWVRSGAIHTAHGRLNRLCHSSLSLSVLMNALIDFAIYHHQCWPPGTTMLSFLLCVLSTIIPPLISLNIWQNWFWPLS